MSSTTRYIKVTDGTDVWYITEAGRLSRWDLPKDGVVVSEEIESSPPEKISGRTPSGVLRAEPRNQIRNATVASLLCMGEEDEALPPHNPGLGVPACAPMDSSQGVHSSGTEMAWDAKAFLLHCAKGDLDGLWGALRSHPELVNSVDTETLCTAAMCAAVRPNADVLKLLVRGGASLEARDYRGMDALARAARFGNVDAIFWLVASKGVDPNRVDDFGMAPLHHAILARERPAVRALLGLGVSTDLKDGKGNTPLALAQSLQEDRLVSILRESPPPSALAQARFFLAMCQEGQAGAVAALLGVNPALANARDPLSGCTALMTAAGAGHLPILRLLHTAGAALDATTEAEQGGYGVLHLAARGGHCPCLAFLLSQGMDTITLHALDARDAQGNTPLHYAHSGAAVRLLLSHGAKLLRNARGLAPLELARERRAGEGVIGALSGEEWGALAVAQGRRARAPRAAARPLAHTVCGEGTLWWDLLTCCCSPSDLPPEWRAAAAPQNGAAAGAGAAGAGAGAPGISPALAAAIEKAVAALTAAPASQFSTALPSTALPPAAPTTTVINSAGRRAAISNGRYYCGNGLARSGEQAHDGSLYHSRCKLCSGKCGPLDGCSCTACHELNVAEGRGVYVHRDG